MCIVCPENTYNPSVGLSGSNSCSTCEPGTWSPKGSCQCFPDPTPAPTFAPTLMPTWAPVAIPTLGPTHAPCSCGQFLDLNMASPTCIECPLNTFNPFGGATHVSACLKCSGRGQYAPMGSCGCLSYPTAEPTYEPTRYPTAIPTLEPSPAPSNYPVANPTQTPSSEPSPFPIPKPTRYPTAGPTEEPTYPPTHEPSAEPTHVACGCGSFLSAAPQDPSAVCVPCSSIGPNYYNPFAGCDGPYCCLTCEEGYIPEASGCGCTPTPTTFPSPSPTPLPSAKPTNWPTNSPIPNPTRLPTTLPTASPTLSCPCGQYVFKSTCKMCLPGTFNPSTTSEVSSDVCYPCLPGFTSKDGACQCVRSPTAAPTLTPTTFPTSHPALVQCPCGSFTDLTTNTCVQCEAGYYTKYPGGALGGCLYCDSGYTSAPGSCSCYPLPTAYPTMFPTLKPTGEPTTYPTVAPSPHPIPHPTQIPSPNPVANPTQHPTFPKPTTLPTLAPTIYQCPCGSYNSHGSGLCIRCGPGTFMPDAGNCEGCYECPAGYTSNEGACSCFVAHTSSPTRFPVSSPTLEPTLEPTDLPTALPTAEPTAEPTNLPTAHPTNIPIANPTMSPTQPPTAYPTRAPIASPTLVPTTFPTHTPCPCGTYLDNNNCALCPANTFSPGVGALCVETCAQCDEGSFSLPGSCRCETTPSPTRGPTVWPTASPTYKNCPCGYFLDMTDDSCVACDVGFYAPFTGMSGCYVCGAGMTSTLGSCSCHPAPPSPEPTLVPSPYPIANPSPFPIAHPTEKPTPAPSSEPTKMPVRLPTAKPTDKLCICECGFYWDGVIGACIPCEHGYFNPDKGAMSESACLVCPAGSNSGAGACTCSFTDGPTTTPTSPPTKAPITAPSALPTYAPVNKVCPCGAYLDFTSQSSQSCLLCAAGTFSPDAGETSALACVSCPPRTTSSAGACSCYTDPTAEPTKTPTTNPIASPTSSPTYGQCPCGTYRENSVCQPCAANYFSPGVGASSIGTCAPCPVGSASSAGACICIFPGPTGFPVAIPTAPPVIQKTDTPSKFPVASPTTYPSTQLQCAEIPYTDCTFDDGFYMSTSCTLQVSLVYEAASTPEIEVLAATKAAISTSSPSGVAASVLIAGVFILVASVSCYAIITRQIKNNGESADTTSTYVKLSSQEEIPFAIAPLKRGGQSTFGDYQSQL